MIGSGFSEISSVLNSTQRPLPKVASGDKRSVINDPAFCSVSEWGSRELIR